MYFDDEESLRTFVGADDEEKIAEFRPNLLKF